MMIVYAADLGGFLSIKEGKPVQSFPHFPSRLTQAQLLSKRPPPAQFLVAEADGLDYVVVTMAVRFGRLDVHGLSPAESTVRLVRLPHGVVYRGSRTANAELLEERTARSDTLKGCHMRWRTYEEHKRALFEELAELAHRYIDAAALADTMPPASMRPRNRL